MCVYEVHYCTASIIVVIFFFFSSCLRFIINSVLNFSRLSDFVACMHLNTTKRDRVQITFTSMCSFSRQNNSTQKSIVVISAEISRLSSFENVSHLNCEGICLSSKNCRRSFVFVQIYRTFIFETRQCFDRPVFFFVFFLYF